jgi:hypothetical protein
MANGAGYCGGDEAVAHFGVGETGQCDVDVKWNEHRIVRRNVGANQSVVLRLE